MDKQYLEELKKQIEDEIDGYSIDFANEHTINDSQYVSDAMNEFADNNTSIYYSDQRDYYNEHSSECDDALLEYMDGDSIADYIKKYGLDNLVCKAGAMGEYEAISRQLYEDGENILALMVVNHLLDNLEGYADIEANKTNDDIDELLNEVKCACNRINRFEEIQDILDEYGF